MIDRSKVETIIESLDLVAKRPKMYFGVDDDPEIAKGYLYGIRHAIRFLAEIDPYLKISKWHDAIEANGYRVTPWTPDREMAEKGMTGKEIILKLIRIEQTLYQSLLDGNE